MIGVTGASGFIGRHVIAALRAGGHEVAGFSRDAGRRIEGTKETRGLAAGVEPNVAGLGAVVHLAGESVMGLWTAGKRKRILESRTIPTRALVAAMAKRPEGPRTLVCASAIGIYGSRGDELLPESAAGGTGFLAEVCREWEAAAMEGEKHGIRVVCVRIGLVLGPDGGALPLLKKVFRLGLGGRMGDGRHWMSWVHVDDVAGLMCHAVETQDLRGALNATAPGPVTNEAFTRALAAAVHRPAFFPVPAFALRLTLRDQAGFFLASQRCVPERTLAGGYVFQQAGLEQALVG